MFRTLLEKLIGLFQKHVAITEPIATEMPSEKPTDYTSPNDWWKDENQMPEYNGDGKECPFCKSTNVRSFKYGLIRFNSDEEREETLKTHALGGCCIDPWSPKYICDACDKRFGLVR